MQLNVNNAQAIEVSEVTFGSDYNETLVHQAVAAQQRHPGNHADDVGGPERHG
mgnify:CR=1 FL=1